MHLPIFYSAMLLTSVNLLLRVVGTSFQVYISGRIGAAGIGLLQLVMSVNGLAVVAGTAGVRTAAMYLTAGEIGKKHPQNIIWVLSGCFGYSILCSSAVAAVLYLSAPLIAAHWLNAPGTEDALRLFSAFLPVISLANVMTGYFTAAKRICTLAAVEVAEQLLSMVITMTGLHFYAHSHPVKACQAVILGNCSAACFTLLCLVFIRLKEKTPTGSPINTGKRLADTAIPLGLADLLKSGINTTENLMVPKRLAMNHRIPNPLASFGMVSGMVFPILMFPACILFGLAELLVPELAQCAAAGSKKRISYLLHKSLRIAMLYGILFGGLEFLLADWLCNRLYGSMEAAGYLKIYALLIPILYCDAITDAMTKGLGQQKICVRYNILTSAMDVALLWFLLPEYGMIGYFASFTITHLINFLLSLRLLLKTTGETLSPDIPMLSAAAGIAAAWGAHFFPSGIGAGTAYLLLLGGLLCLFQVTGREDLLWIRGLFQKK